MSPLETLIRDRIADNGPMPVAKFMELALGHPEHGYYMSRDPFGAAGDFVTAPEISQMFGELLGLWAAITWQKIGSPETLNLVECGPGRGTLMNDFLRAAKLVPGFHRAIDIHLVEISATMRALQKTNLPDYTPRWHNAIATVPAGPLIVIANEFLDALPIDQWVMTDSGWAERCVDIGPSGLVFVTGAPVSEGRSAKAPSAAVGDIFETCPAAMAFADVLAHRLNMGAGAALLIDYGHLKSAAGETLQALRNHNFANPLSSPGEADLTAHVDFDAISHRLTSCGITTNGPVTQAAFLNAIGIRERTEQLLQNASADVRAEMNAASTRLTDPAQMGELFKVIVATSPEIPRLAGFESWTEKPC